MNMQYTEALDALHSLGPELRTGNALAPAQPPRKFSLDHIRVLLDALGNPQSRFPSVLIAGTNGKGSTAATLASICNAAGLRTGLYTSPHLERVNERMQIAGKPIADETFGRVFGRVWQVAHEQVAAGRLPHVPSFFEFLTATAFCFFAEEHIEIAILEVGLGGRLDATNAVEPIVSVITDIGLDHMEFLGNTLDSIAREKAGILRRNGVLVTLSQHPEANAAIGDVAMALGVRGVDAARALPVRQQANAAPLEALRAHEATAQLFGVNRNELEGPVPLPGAATMHEVSASTPSPLGRNRYDLALENTVLHIDSPLTGQHQQRNIALALATALELRSNHGFALSNEAIEKGVRDTVWPGRLEWIPSPATAASHPAHAPMLLDVAHNPAGAWTLRAALAALPEEQPRTLLFSCLADKQIQEMARILFPLFDATSGDPARRRDHIVFAPIANPRAASVQQLLDVAHAMDVPAHAAPHLQAALHQAWALTPHGGVIVVTGSVYLIGEARALALAQHG